jgi:hypothetical protein
MFTDTQPRQTWKNLLEARFQPKENAITELFHKVSG